MHNSRRLQLEQATLMAWGFIFVISWGSVSFALDQTQSINLKNRLELINTKSNPKKQKTLYLFDVSQCPWFAEQAHSDHCSEDD
jgi:hypothetical protein